MRVSVARGSAMMMVFLGWFYFSAAAQTTDGTFYVLSGPLGGRPISLRRVHGDPNASDCKQWEVWLFKKNSDWSKFDNRWGVLESKSPQGC
jgi:hypothetical protein